jgi:hypothetical protein
MIGCFLMGAPRSGWAQNTNSSEIRGTVSDATGAIVPGVSVSVLNTDTGVTTSVGTNDAGIYDAVSILPGHYELTFSKPGFNKLVRHGVELNVGLTTIDAQLTVANQFVKAGLAKRKFVMTRQNGYGVVDAGVVGSYTCGHAGIGVEDRHADCRDNGARSIAHRAANFA